MLCKIISNGSKAVITAFIKTIKDFSKPERMGKEEAMKILNLKENFTKEEFENNFEDFYARNSIKNQGSYFIQESIREAKEVLEKLF